MLGSNSPLLIWEQFVVRCYSYGGTAETLRLDIIGVPGPDGSNCD